MPKMNRFNASWSFADLAAALVATIVTLTWLAPGVHAAEATAQPSTEIWDELKPDFFGDRPIKADTGLVTVIAPKRAEDAALVPLDIHIDPSKSSSPVKSVTVVIDANPAPLAATFGFGKDSGITDLSTRVRVNDYSYIRAIVETENGELHMGSTYVKSSGGCSAPALKNQDEAKTSMGLMKLRQFPAKAAGAEGELQLLIRHPNNSGYQMDQVTRYFIPPHFINKLDITQGDALLLSMESGISISEDPNFRFNFKSNGAAIIHAKVKDTAGLEFANEWPTEQAGL